MSEATMTKLLKRFAEIYTHDALLRDPDMVVEACGFLRCMYALADYNQQQIIKGKYIELSLLYIPYHNV